MKTTRLLPPAGLFKLTPMSLLLGATVAAAQAPDAGNQIEEVIVRSSPLLSTSDEIALGTTVLDRQGILQYRRRDLVQSARRQLNLLRTGGLQTNHPRPRRRSDSCPD